MHTTIINKCIFIYMYIYLMLDNYNRGSLEVLPRGPLHRRYGPGIEKYATFRRANQNIDQKYCRGTIIF